MQPTDGRVCVVCKVYREREHFTPHPTGKNGLQSKCRDCMRAVYAQNRADPVYRAAAAERTRQRRTDPAIRARDRETSQDWKRRNPERAAALSNKPEKRAKDRERRQTPRGRLLSLMATYRRMARVAGGDFTQDEWLEVLAEFHYRCGYCLAEGPLEIEHVHPISKGGKHTRSNIVPACRRCNTRKNARTLLRALQLGAIG